MKRAETGEAKTRRMKIYQILQKRINTFVFSNLLVFLIIFLSSACNENNKSDLIPKEAILISPDNPNYQYTGRIDFSKPKEPALFWAGTSIKARFTGSMVKIFFDDENGDNYYNVIIDKNISNRSVIRCDKGSRIYPIVSGLENTVHQIEIVRRTDAKSAKTLFKGLLVDRGEKLIPPPERPGLKIEFYGNSITSGHGILDESRQNNNDKSTWDNYFTYAALTARNLNAEYHCISMSGIGLMVSSDSLIMPQIYDRLNPKDGKSKWNFSDWTPDIVVINLFQNDSWRINTLLKVPNEGEIIGKYIDFVQKIRHEHPNAEIFCALGNMDVTRNDSEWPGYIEKAVEKLNNELNDTKVYSIIFPFKYTAGHPTISEHAIMAKRLTDFIKEKSHN
jgi:hypothetical protein